MKPRDTIERFDTYLHKRGLRLEAVVIGGAALELLGIVSRSTRDCDILVPDLSEQLLDAARAFAGATRTDGEHLDDDWLNNGPASLVRDLQVGWQDRLVPAFSGHSIVLRSLGRLDLLGSKLFALCDRALDLADCVALAPTLAELDGLRAWLEERDTNPDWPAHVHATLNDLKLRLGHGA